MKIRGSLSSASLAALCLFAAPLPSAAEPPDGSLLRYTATPFDLGGDDYDVLTAVVTDARNRPVAAGYASDASFREIGILARWSPTGPLDLLFGTNGKVVDPLGWAGLGSYGFADLAILPDGKLVAVGGASHPSLTGGDAEILVARFTPTGELDTSFFAPHGFRLVAFDVGGDLTDTATSIAVQEDGKLIVAGWSVEGAAARSARVVRLLADGLVDPSFDGDGLLRLSLGGGAVSAAYDVAALPDGRTVVMGYHQNSTTYDLAVARLLADGSLDPSFGSGGRRVLTADLWVGDELTFPRGLAVDAEGALFVAGFSANLMGEALWAVAKVDPNGSIDSTFGAEGWAAGDFRCFDLPWSSCAGAHGADVGAVLVQGDGKVLITGSGTVAAGAAENAVGIARLNAEGALDPTFGTGGQTLLPIDYGSAGTEFSNSAVLGRDGRPVVVGGAYFTGNDSDALVAWIASSYVFADGFESGSSAAWSP